MSEVKIEYLYKTKEDPSNEYWFNVPEPHDHVFAAIAKIESANSQDYDLAIRHARLYSDIELLGLQVLNRGEIRAEALQRILGHKVTFNLVKSAIDTLTNKIGKNKPKISFLTSGGDWETSQKAKKLSKYIEGVFHQEKVYNKAIQVLRDALIFGTGCFKIYTEGGKVRLDRTLITEIKVDQNDGIYGEPSEIHQVRYINRDVLLEQYPEHEDYIKFAQSSTDDSSSVDLLKVVESWKLFRKHTICINECTLFSEEATEDNPLSSFPFVFFRFSDRLVGFYGAGLAEELTGFQLEINKLLRNISEAIHLVAVPRVYLETGSNISAAQITNKIAGLINYTGRPPTFETPTAMTSEVYSHLKWLIQSGFEAAGISQLTATSKKPVGLESAVALREYNDIETERFITLGMGYEDFFINLSHKVLELSRKMYTDSEDDRLTVNTGRFIESMNWKDIDLNDDQFTMKPYPVSLLPTTPAGRLQKVQELIEAGFVNKEQALSLLDFPDVEEFKSLEVSGSELIHKLINEIIESGKYVNPEPRMDLKKGVKICNQYYLRGKVEGMKEKTLRHLAQFMDDCERLIELGIGVMTEEATANQAMNQPPVDPAMIAPPAPIDPMAMPPVDPMAAMPAPVV